MENRLANPAPGEPIAIVGLAAYFPGSFTVAEFFRNTLRKRCFVRELPEWLWERDLFFSEDHSSPFKTYSHIGGLLGDFDPDLSGFAIPPAVVDQMSRNQKLALLCARDALADAGYLERDFDRENAMVILAAMAGDGIFGRITALHSLRMKARMERLATEAGRTGDFDRLWREYEDAFPAEAITEDTLTGWLSNIAAARIASVFDLKGPTFALDSACASTLAALTMAVSSLRSGVCGMVLCGGVDADMGVESYVELAKMNAISASGSFPFDARADGFVPGEGCGILVLKRLADAERDSDRIYALIRGCGGSSDGRGKGIMAPSSDGQLRAMRRAYHDAGIPPAALRYMECHGTGTRVGDAVELDSVSRLIADPELGPPRDSDLPIGSGKAALGHLKLAAGAVGVIRAVLAVNSRIVPPQVNFEVANPAFAWENSKLRIPVRPEPMEAGEVAVGVSGFGFGGANYHAVISSSPVNSRAAVVDAREFILPAFPPLASDIAFIFPGQGSQYVGMLESLRSDPLARDYLERADRIVAAVSGHTISDRIFPPSAGRTGRGRTPGQEDALRVTWAAQPAIFTVSAILLDKVRQLGIRCGMAFGLSLGETAALYAAGMLGFDEAIQVVAMRGRIMSDLPKGDKGAMASVNAGLERTKELLGKIEGYIACANVNAYEQTVVTGEGAAVAAFIDLASRLGLQARLLKVDRAFHSRFIAPCRDCFRTVLEGVPVRPASVPVPANISRQVFPYANEKSRWQKTLLGPERQRFIDLHSRMLSEPADFVSQVETAYEAGIRRFIEIGPRDILTGLVGEILQGRPFQAIGLDRRRDPLHALAQLRNTLSGPIPFPRRPLPTKPWKTSERKPLEASKDEGIAPADRVRCIVSQVSGYAVEKVADDTEFERDLGIDTLKIFEIIARLRGSLLPIDFSDFRQATSIRKILAQAAVGAGRYAVAAAQPVNDLQCFRFGEIEVGTGPPAPVDGCGDSSRDILIVKPLSGGPEELCGKTIPGLLREAIAAADRAMQTKTEPLVHVVTHCRAERFSQASYRTVAALVKSFQHDLPYLRFSYSHLDADAPGDGDFRLLAALPPVLGRRITADGRILEGRLHRQPIPETGRHGLAGLLGADDVVLVSGGTRGIAARIVRALLPVVQARFILIGRRPADAEWSGIAGRERVECLQADLCDPEAVGKLDLSRRGITLLVHAAGVIFSRPLRNVTAAEMAQVLETKILGLHRLLAAIESPRLRGIVAFSSTAGCFGAAGNLDYAAANGYLAGLSTAPTPLLAIAWSAWAEVGMASNEATRQFLDTAGITQIPLEKGIAAFANLLADFLSRGRAAAGCVAVHAGMAGRSILDRDPLKGDAPAATTGPSATALWPLFGDGESAIVASMPSGLAAAPCRCRLVRLGPAQPMGLAGFASIFTAAEKREIEAERTAKRRLEKIAGKLSAKLLVRDLAETETAVDCAPGVIEVLSDRGPVRVGSSGDLRLQGLLAGKHFSISHSGRLACAAAADVPVGIDVEALSPLSDAAREGIIDGPLRDAMDDFLQNAPVTDPAAPGEEFLPIIAFSQKEAVLKAAGIGLAEGLGPVRLAGFAVGAAVDATCWGERYRVLSALHDGHVISLAWRGEKNVFTSPAGGGRGRTITPSFGQEGLWLQEQMEGIGPVNTVGWSDRLQGPLDAGILRRSLQHVVDRHETLRTTYPGNGETMRTFVLGELVLPMETIDMAEQGPERALAEARSRCELEMERGFDLAKGPLLRIILFRLGPDDHLLFAACHHSIVDASSVLNFRREWVQAYVDFQSGRPPRLPAIAFSTSEFARRQRTALTASRLDKLLGHWRTVLADAPALLELPVNHRRPGRQDFTGASEPFTIPVDLLRSLRDLAKKEGVTLFVVFLAAFQILLSRLCGQDDVVVGAPFSLKDDPASFPLIGYLVNMLPLKGRPAPAIQVGTFLKGLRAAVMEAMAHKDLPFPKLLQGLHLRRDGAFPPVFQAILAVSHCETGGVTLPGFRHDFHEIPPAGTAFELALMVSVQEKAECRFDYAAALFSRETIRSWSQCLTAILKAFSRAAPDLRLGDIQIIAEAEKIRTLCEWNATAVPIPELGLHELFAAQARRDPQAEAVWSTQECLTYRELDDRANRLAARLHRNGVRKGAIVGVLLERSAGALIAFLAVLKAGGAYLPLDPDDPPARRSFLIRDSGAKLVITTEALASGLHEISVPVLGTDGGDDAPDGNGEALLAASSGPADTACILYTSGSTGSPKGVLVLHQGIVRLLFGIDYVDLVPPRTILQMAPLTFDASTFEIWGALLHGGRCVIFPERIPSIASLGAILSGQRIDTLWLNASLFNAIVDEAPEILAGIKQLLIGGEPLSVAHVCAALEKLPATRIVNGYGPTEATTFTCCHRVPRTLSAQSPSVPIGRPIANTTVYLLDPSGHPCPIGVPGEIHIGGRGVARAYLNRPDLDRERFVPDPFGAAPGNRLYKSGDRARWLPDGTIEFLGRRDDQVKIRGFRVEPAEIESELRKHPAVRGAVVAAIGDGQGSRRLAAGIIPEPPCRPTAAELKEFIRRRLPAFMIPETVSFFDSFPVSFSGKIDRRAVASMLASREEGGTARRPPTGARELELARIWKDILGHEQIGADDDFFDLGGHSLLAVRAAARITWATGLPVTVNAIFRFPTVSRLAAHLQSADGKPDDSPLLPLQVRGDKPPFFAVHFYGNFQTKMTPDQPLYLLKHDGAPPHATEDLAARYVSALRSVQPRGPYRLGGFSFGGLIALEMARQLRDLNEEIALLFLLDPTPLAGASSDSASPSFWSRHWRRLKRLDARGQIAYISRRLAIRLNRPIRRLRQKLGLPLPAAIDWALYAEMSSRYSPVAFDGPTVFVSGIFNTLESGWKRTLAGPLHAHYLPADHLAFFKDPVLTRWIQLLEEALAKPPS